MCSYAYLATVMTRQVLLFPEKPTQFERKRKG